MLPVSECIARRLWVGLDNYKDYTGWVENFWVGLDLKKNDLRPILVTTTVPKWVVIDLVGEFIYTASE
jgi:hypothetical protein